MTRLVRTELLKLRTTRMFLGFVVAAVGLVTLVTALQLAVGDGSSLSIEGASDAVRTEEDLRSIMNVSGVAALFAVVLGATAVAGEHRHGTIVSTYLITPRRARVIVAKAVAYALAGAVLALAVEGAVLALVSGWLLATGVPVPLGPSVALALVLTPLATAMAAAVGIGVGAAIPNQLGAVLAVLGWVMVVEQLVGGLFPAIAEWLPFGGASTAVAGHHPTLGVGGGFALFLGYVLIVNGLGIWFTRARDVA